MTTVPLTTAGRRRLLHLLALTLTLALVAAACGGTDDDASPSASTTPEADTGDPAGGAGTGDDAADELALVDGPISIIVANTPGTVRTGGPQRVMTALLGPAPNDFRGGPDQPVEVRFAAVDAETTGESTGEWLTTDASPLGLYVSSFAFPQPGLWEVTVTAGGESVGSTLLEVVEDSDVPNVGDPAPPTVSATAATAEEIAVISTDPDPDPSLYDLSIDEAVANGRPTVIAFATPAFCQTALCGPTMETVKAVAGGRDDLDVVHVEPFDLALAPQGTLQPIPIMDDWGLVTEPWVFVVDADGLVTASFEGIIGSAELERAIAGL